MVYGKGCKGNYQTLRRLSLLTPVFPAWKNRRSMIYIDNLCDFIEMLIREEKAGLFFPQNEEYVCTADMVQKIALEHGKKVRLIKGLNLFVKFPFVPYRDKVFGSLIYDSEEDKCCAVEKFEETIQATES